MIVDTHCHLYDDCYDEDREEIISSLLSNNIKSAFVVGTDLETSKQALHLAETHKNLFAIIGMYPEYAEKYNAEFETFLRKNAQNPKVVAIGEIGLDYHTEGYNSALQKEILKKQIKIAFENKLPLSIHARESFGDILEVFEECKQELKFGGVIHCFTGSKEVARQFINYGFKLGIGGVCTFKNARKVVETLEDVSEENLLLETDAPYLAPVPFRGSRNEPKQTNIVLQKIAEIKNIDSKKLEEIIYQNALSTFKKYKD
jgi:TatD DNase family protein